MKFLNGQDTKGETTMKNTIDYNHHCQLVINNDYDYYQLMVEHVKEADSRQDFIGRYEGIVGNLMLKGINGLQREFLVKCFNRIDFVELGGDFYDEHKEEVTA